MYENEDDMYWDLADTDIKKSDGICKFEMDYDSYSSEDEGDYYNICINGDECIKAYPFERGMIMEVDGECEAFVSDINDPPTYSDSSEESYDVFQEETDKWKDKWTDIGYEILEDDDAVQHQHEQCLPAASLHAADRAERRSSRSTYPVSTVIWPPWR